MDLSEDDKLVLAATRMLLKTFEKGSDILMALEKNERKERQIFGYQGINSSAISVIGSFAQLCHETKGETDAAKLRKDVDTHVDVIRVALLLKPDGFQELLGLLKEHADGRLETPETNETFVRLVDVLLRQVSKEYLLGKYERYLATDFEGSAAQHVGAVFSGKSPVGQDKVWRKKTETKEPGTKVLRKVPSLGEGSTENIGSSSGRLGKAGHKYIELIPAVRLKRHHDAKKAEKAAAGQQTPTEAGTQAESE